MNGSQRYRVASKTASKGGFRAVTSRLSHELETPSLPGDIMSLKCHHRCQIPLIAGALNIDLFSKNEYLLKIFYNFRIKYTELFYDKPIE